MNTARKPFCLRSVVGLAVTAALGVGGVSCSSEPPQRVVLITIDTLRYDTFAGRPRLEALDKDLAENDPGIFVEGERELVTAMPLTRTWARDAAQFERCYTTSPVTQPAHASLFTGLFPWQHGVTRNAQVLGANQETVAEILKAGGFETAAVVASYPLTRRMGLDQGFDRYVDELDLNNGDEWNGRPVDEFYSLGAAVTDRALELLDGFEDSQQFLWVHYFDPHAPYGDADDDEKQTSMSQLMKAVFKSKYLPAAGAGISRAQRLYESDVRSLDRELQRLLKRLKADEAEFETHIVFVADHGESFGEDDSLGHGRRLTEPQLRIPLVIHSPLATAGRYSAPVGSVDVAATLLALADSGRRFPHGRNLLQKLDRPELVAGMRTTFKGVLNDNRVEGGKQKLRGKRWFLYEDSTLLAGDPKRTFVDDDEDRPAAEAQAERAQQLFSLFADQMTGAVELDDEATRAAMEALGYLGSDDE